MNKGEATKIATKILSYGTYARSGSESQVKYEGEWVTLYGSSGRQAKPAEQKRQLVQHILDNDESAPDRLKSWNVFR